MERADRRVKIQTLLRLTSDKYRRSVEQRPSVCVCVCNEETVCFQL